MTTTTTTTTIDNKDDHDGNDEDDYDDNNDDNDDNDDDNDDDVVQDNDDYDDDDAAIFNDMKAFFMRRKGGFLVGFNLAKPPGVDETGVDPALFAIFEGLARIYTVASVKKLTKWRAVF